MGQTASIDERGSQPPASTLDSSVAIAEPKTSLDQPPTTIAEVAAVDEAPGSNTATSEPVSEGSFVEPPTVEQTVAVSSKIQLPLHIPGAASSVQSSTITAGQNVVTHEVQRTRMKAWVCQSPSESLDSITTTQMSIPVPGEGEIRVRVVCAGINPIDYKRASFPTRTDHATGVAGDPAITYYSRGVASSDSDEGAPYPYIMGCDGAGVVEELGTPPAATASSPQQGSSGSTVSQSGLAVGDRVYFHNDIRRPDMGTFAEFTLCTAAAVCKIPDTMSFADAAAIPCAGWTAYVALFEKLRVEAFANRTIVIVGAGGGVGSFAVDFARLSGLRIITVTGTDNVAHMVRDKGVDLALDYNMETEVTLSAKVLGHTWSIGADYLLDCVGLNDRQLQMYAHLLRFSGAICSVVGDQTMAKSAATHMAMVTRQLSLHFVFLGGLHRQPSTQPMLRFVGEQVLRFFGVHEPGTRVASGDPLRLRMPMSSNLTEIVRFDQIPSALSVLRQGHVRGKIVMSFVHPSVAKRAPVAASASH